MKAKSKIMSGNPLCSVIVLTYDNLEHTKLCIEALSQHTSLPYELILVDNASTDGTINYLKNLNHAIKIFNHENAGFAKGSNQGASQAKGKYLVFLNNDTIPQKNWLEEMVNAIEKFPKIGIVGSLLLFPDGTIQHAGVLLGEPYFTNHMYKGEKKDYPPAQIPKILQAVTGACILIPRSLFFEMNGFDEEYMNGFEDIDLCMKVRKAGYRVLYWPKSILIHFESVSKGRFRNDCKNMERFKEKWKGFYRLDASAYNWEGNFFEIPKQAVPFIYDGFVSLQLSLFPSTEPLGLSFLANSNCFNASSFLP